MNAKHAKKGNTNHKGAISRALLANLESIPLREVVQVAGTATQEDTKSLQSRQNVKHAKKGNTTIKRDRRNANHAKEVITKRAHRA